MIRRLLCRLGFHDWQFQHERGAMLLRTCSRCPRAERCRMIYDPLSWSPWRVVRKRTDDPAKELEP
jgi:hypothetical protein